LVDNETPPTVVNNNSSSSNNMSLALNPSAESFTPFSSSSSSTTTSTTFPLEELHEELILFILSFVTDVPYEESSTGQFVWFGLFGLFGFTLQLLTIQSYRFLCYIY
jgi:hypothetical protein